MADCDPAVRHAEMVYAALQALGLPNEAGKPVLVGAVVVCDWLDGTDKRWLSLTSTPGLTWWQRDGLLTAALDMAEDGDE